MVPYLGRAKQVTNEYPRHSENQSVSSGLHQLKCTHTIAFPVSPAGGEVQAMRGHRQAFPTPRGSGKRDPKGGVARLPDVVGRRLWCTTPRRDTLLAGNLATPSYGRNLADKGD